MKFRTRLTIAFAVLTLLMISVELLFSHLGTARHDQQMTIRNLLTTSQQATHHIDTLLQETSRDMEVIARSAFLNEPGRSTAAMNQRLADFREASAPVERLTFLNTAGVVVADSSALELGKVRKEVAWQNGMAGKSGFLIHDEQGQLLLKLLFFVPVRRGGTATPKGVVIATVPINHLQQLMDDFQSYRMTGPDRLRIELIDQAGRMFYSSDVKEAAKTAAKDGPRSNYPDRTAKQRVQDRGDDLQLLTLSEGLSNSSTGQWYLRVIIPKAQILAEARSRLFQKIVISLALFSVSIIIIYLLAGRLSQPLEILSQAVRHRGEGDSGPLDHLPERHDEFALLQESLQEMSGRLQESLERLTRSEERFHALFDAMAEGAALHRILYDLDGSPQDYLIEEINQSYEQMLGVKREQVVGRPATAIHQVACAPYLQEFATVVATGQASRFETYFAPLDRYFMISVCRVGPERFAAFFFDVTTEKWHVETLHNTMQQLKEANEAKSRFLAVMSHEIRTPLNGITGMVQLLQDMDMPAVQREFLDNIDSSADSLLTVINDILDFSKIEAGRMELEQVPFKPQTFLANMLRVLRLRAQAKGLLLNLVCDLKPSEVLLGDPHRLAQIFNNLVGNAIKFTAAGEISIRAATEAKDEETVLFSVSVQDCGIGMDEATQKNIFDPFIQADSSTTRKYGGTGLGLAICKQLVELMNGSIAVSSQPGFGSTFSFSVPLKRGVLLEETETVESDSRSLDHPLRVLVAEDQPVNQRFVAEILRKQGHHPLLAANGREAVAIWQQEPLDLVLMDIQMPEMDGLKALAAIRAAEDLSKRHIPIVALTAHAIVGDRERLLNAGFDGYLSKPLQVAQLFKEMSRVLEEISVKRGRE